MRSTSTAALSVFAVALSSMPARADDPSAVSVQDAASGCAFVNAPIVTRFFIDGCTSVFGICTAGTIDSGMLAGSTQFTLLTLGPGDLPGQLVYSGQLVITAAGGSLTINDSGALNPDGTDFEIDPIVSGTGDFGNGAGTLFSSGTRTPTGFDGTVAGRICLLPIEQTN